MIEIMNWIAESGWRFIGVLIYIVVTGVIISLIAESIRGK